jgi:hypothetical protein
MILADLVPCPCQVHDDASQFSALLKYLPSDVRLALDALHPWSRWITPKQEKKRFDTRFYLYCLDGATTSSPPEVTSDGGETTEAAWVSPAEALIATSRDDAPWVMFPPQLWTLHEFQSNFASLAALKKEAQARTESAFHGELTSSLLRIETAGETKLNSSNSSSVSSSSPNHASLPGDLPSQSRGFAPATATAESTSSSQGSDPGSHPWPGIECFDPLMVQDAALSTSFSKDAVVRTIVLPGDHLHRRVPGPSGIRRRMEVEVGPQGFKKIHIDVAASSASPKL